jgi:cytochrome c oxidase subunit 4
MMVAKFFIVVSYFMHLKFDKKIFSFLFYAGLFLAIGVYVAFLATFHFFIR